MLKFNLIKFHIRYLSSNTKLLKGTLTLRFHDYLTSHRNDDNYQKSKIIENVEKISEKSRDNFLKIKLMDKSYLNSLRNRMKEDEMIECLHYLVENYPNQVVNLRFYSESLRILLSNPEICQKYFIQLCFLIGSLKKHQPGPEYLQKLLNSCLTSKLNSKEINRMDFAILCISTYKASVRIHDEKFHARLIDEVLATNDEDTFLLVAFIKSLKQNQVTESRQVIQKLKELIEVFEFDYASLVHILPYIADNNIKDDKLVQSICEKCIKTFDENVRAKDVQKFLHSCAMLNLKMKKSELEKLESVIMARTLSDEFDTHFDHFVNATLSLWILNHHSQKLVNVLYNDERFHKTGPQTRIKLDSRMKLLETCVEIEKPNWIQRRRKDVSFIENRSSPLYLIKSSLEKAMNMSLNGKKGIFVQQIKNLNIAGILVTSDNIHYEILDKNTSLSDKKTFNGIFQLKLRLLRKLKCNVKVIPVF